MNCLNCNQLLTLPITGKSKCDYCPESFNTTVWVYSAEIIFISVIFQELPDIKFNLNFETNSLFMFDKQHKSIYDENNKPVYVLDNYTKKISKQNLINAYKTIIL